MELLVLLAVTFLVVVLFFYSFSFQRIVSLSGLLLCKVDEWSAFEISSIRQTNQAYW